MKIRKISKDDLETRVSWMNNPNIYSTMNFTPPISLERTKEWFSVNMDNPNRFDAVFLDKEDNILSFGGLTNIDFFVKKAEFYIFVNPEMQKQGIGTKAAYLLCKYGFEFLQLHKIYLFTNVSNLGAQRTYEKIGFVKEGRFRDEKIIEGHYEDRLYYGMLHSDFDFSRYELIFI